MVLLWPAHSGQRHTLRVHPWGSGCLMGTSLLFMSQENSFRIETQSQVLFTCEALRMDGLNVHHCGYDKKSLTAKAPSRTTSVASPAEGCCQPPSPWCNPQTFSTAPQHVSKGRCEPGYRHGCKISQGEVSPRTELFVFSVCYRLPLGLWEMNVNRKDWQVKWDAMSKHHTNGSVTFKAVLLS